MEREDLSCPSPRPPPSSVFKDLSNFKTPKRPPHLPNFHTPSTKFFTSSKQTPLPASSFRRHRPSLDPSSCAFRSRAARKLKAFELEQSQSSRKVQIRKEQSLKSLAKSLTVWLNFLFENPHSCGCDWPQVGEADSTKSQSKGKRDCRPHEAVGVYGAWRCPKRHRDVSWQPVGQDNGDNLVDFSFPKMSKLGESLKDICSFDDLMQRMRLYLNLKNCEDVCKMMAQLTKNIDDGRIKMKVHCPIVTDVGLKEKATQVLMSYNPIWLRIGLFVIFGGDTLLSDDSIVSDQETSLSKMIIDKQFFAHSSLAKAYSYNKKVEGLYRPGYYENLGKIILKRFLLMVLILDKVKCQTNLPLKYGIDGIDGGSPLLFKVQSGIKSSSQMIQDFLPTDVMHGEGNLISHLVIVGYKVSYQQDPLSEYSFKITDLFVDIQDGVRLCRAIQILQNNSSIMMKILIPSDTRKKNLANCTIALQNLKQAGVMMCDEDGMEVTGDDIVDRDKELILSILWNMFIHLQLPLLINKTLMLEEVRKIHGQENTLTINSTPLEMLFNWIKEICNTYNQKIDSFSALVDGKGIWCLLDYYFRKDLTCSSTKDPNSSRIKESIVSATDYPDAAHNFVMSSKLMKILGNFPEILQISDILEFQGVSSVRSVVIFLMFLASELIMNKSVERLNLHKFLVCDCRSSNKNYLSSKSFRLNGTTVQDGEELGSEDFATKFKAVQSWWKKMVDQNRKSLGKSNSPSYFTAKTNTSREEKAFLPENAVKIIQSHGRRYILRQRYLKSINNIIFLQTFIRLCSNRRRQSTCINLVNPETFSCETNQQLQPTRKYIMFTIDRQSFLYFKRSVLLIQQASRNWISGKNLGRVTGHSMSSFDHLSAVIVIQKYVRLWLQRSRDMCNVSKMEESLDKSLQTSDQLQEAPVNGNEICRLAMAEGTLFNQHLAANKIQSNFRRWFRRRMYDKQKWATTVIQKDFRMIRCRKVYKMLVASVIIIQSFVRRWIVRKFLSRQKHCIAVIQSNFRGWLIRRQLSIQQEAAIKIQSAVRCMICWKGYNLHRQATIEIQRLARGKIVRSRLIGGSRLQADINHGSCLSISGGCSIEFKIFFMSVLKLQKWWRRMLRSKSAVVIQSHIRGWIVRRKVATEKNCVLVIQSYWRRYLVHRESKEQLLDLCFELQQSANVNDRNRSINRLVKALPELLKITSVRRILHICACLDTATKHSSEYCETLVAAGVIVTLVKLIRSISRSIPDQQILVHALSTLRNIACYSHLGQVLIETRGSIDTLILEFLRNKEEAYFIASELLKKICASDRGIEAVRKSPAFVRRLRSLVNELTRKISNQKNNNRGKENSERRLREAVQLLKLIAP